MTNADKIRTMTDEELADLIGENIDCAICKSMNGRDFMGECPAVGVAKWPGKECHGMWLEWLREEGET